MSLVNILKTHSAAKIKDQKTGKMVLVDVQSANTVLKLYNSLSSKNKESLLKMGVTKMIKTAYDILVKIMVK